MRRRILSGKMFLQKSGYGSISENVTFLKGKKTYITICLFFLLSSSLSED